MEVVSVSNLVSARIQLVSPSILILQQLSLVEECSLHWNSSFGLSVPQVLGSTPQEKETAESKGDKNPIINLYDTGTSNSSHFVSDEYST